MKSARPYRQTHRADSVADTRAQILQAARAVLEDSVGDLSLEAVALRADVGRPTIYRHFGSRATLFSAVIADVSDTHGLAGEIKKAVEDGSMARFVSVSTRMWAREIGVIRGALRLARDPEIAVAIRALEGSRYRDALRLARLSRHNDSVYDRAHALMMLTSPSNFLYLIDDLGMQPAKARQLLAKMAHYLEEGHA